MVLFSNRSVVLSESKSSRIAFQCIIDEFTRESLAIHFKKQLEKECGLSLIDPYKRLTHARAIFANPVVMDKTGRTFETGIYRRNDGRCANGATNRPAIEGSVGLALDFHHATPARYPDTGLHFRRRFKFGADIILGTGNLAD